MKDTIKKHVLNNALNFNGKVNRKAVLGQVLREETDYKKDIPGTLKKIEKISIEIEKLSLVKIKEELKKISPKSLVSKTKKEIKGPLKELSNAKKNKVVVRIAPSPSGALHIGHAYGASLNYEYAKMYRGKFILRIEDTNPENIYPQAYQLIEDDANWLTDNNVSQIIIQSSRLGIYYDHAEKLVNMGHSYMCTCNADKFREMKSKGEACPCRDLDTKEQQTRFAKMFSSYAEGEAVLRLKTDIKHKNPAMRDFAIMRINEHIHPKTGKKQRVWPLMVLAVAIDDHQLNVTHVLNGKDHTDNAKKEAIIMKCFGWQSPIYKHWGRINFEGMKLSSSETKLAIEQKKFSGWDDLRLPFIPALRKRGYQAESIRRFATEIGLSLNDKKVSQEEFWKMINSFNKEIIEPKSNRYFFVNDPVAIKIDGAPNKTINIDFHPDFPKRGKRKISGKEMIYITKHDHKKLAEGKIHRLMDYCNFKIVKGKFKFISEDYEDYKNNKKKGFIIHWLPQEDGLVETTILLNDGNELNGFGEKSLLKLKTGSTIQMERFAFCHLDKKIKSKLIFCYLHK